MSYPPNTIVKCGRYQLAAYHADCLCERCGARWTVGVMVNGQWWCWTCAGEPQRV